MSAKWRPTPGYVCACLVCGKARHDRDVARILSAYKRRKLAESVEELMTLKVGQRVVERASRHLDATWRSQDGRETPVQSMSQAHLLYALAKGYRGEYAPRSWAADKFEALESELLRRLAGVAGTDRQRAAHVREAQARTAAGY